MPIVEIDKDSDSIIFIEEGKIRTQSIRKEDCVISVAPKGFKKVLNVYVEPTSGQLVIIHEK